MSYDLDFLVGPEREPIRRDEFMAYFAGRPHYTIDGDQAFYGNDDTGGVFWFDWTANDAAGEVEDDDAPPDDLRPAGVHFEINYNRPFWFADEAEPELSAFVQSMGLRVHDPQADGMGRGDYERQGFLDGWRTGNRFALRVLRSQGAPEPPLLDRESIRQVRAWNASRAELQSSLGDFVFVPRIFYVSDAGAIRTLITWTWDVQTAIPDVERAVMVRLPGGLLGRFRGTKTSMIDAGTIPSTEPRHEWTGGPYRLSAPATDERVQGLFRGWLPQEIPPGVPDDEIFELEDYRDAVRAGEGAG